MFGLALAVAAVSLIAFLVVLVLGMRFFGALAGDSRANEQLSDNDNQSLSPQFLRFDLRLRDRK